MSKHDEQCNKHNQHNKHPNDRDKDAQMIARETCRSSGQLLHFAMEFMADLVPWFIPLKMVMFIDFP